MSAAAVLPLLLRTLLTTPGPSGAEAGPAAVFRDAARAFAEVTTDVMGSVRARVPGTGDGPALAVIGHVDEISLLVVHVDEAGFVRFTTAGRWDPQQLVGQRVEILAAGGARVPGVIGRTPVHLLSAEQRARAADVSALSIDIGAASASEALALVAVGDPAVLTAEPLELPNRRAASRAMDNRLGCFVALEAARLVAEAGGAPGDVIAVAAVQEEAGLGGAQTTANALRPDVALVVDVTYATDTPGASVTEGGAHPLGSGPVIERGSLIHPGVSSWLRATAEREGIPFTMAASHRTGTDLDVVHVSGAGVPSGLIGIPIRYMHSPVELVQLDDVERAARLIAAAALRLPPKLRSPRW